MQVTVPAVCFLLAFGHFLLLVWPRVVNPFFGVDCWRHMLAAESIRRSGTIPDRSIDNYMFSGPFDYPPLLPVFLAAFPRGFRLLLQAVLSPLVEACHGILVFWAVFHLTGSCGAAALSQLLFVLVPITALENSQLTARTPGSLLLTLSLVGAAAFSGTGNWLWFALALTAATLIHFTHKMASQALLLLSLLAVVVCPWLWAVVLIGPLSLLVAFGLAPRLIKRIIVGHIAVLRYYWRIFMATGKTAGSVESPSLVGRLVKLARANPLVTAAGADPWIIFLLLVAALDWPAARELPAILPFWLGAVYVLIVATSWIRPLRFLGDGPRYSYYLAFPVAVSSGLLAAPCLALDGIQHVVMLTVLAAGGVGVAAGIVFLQFKAVVGDRERSLRGDVQAVVGILKGAAHARVLVLPLCTAEIVTYFAGCRVLSTDSALVHAEDVDFRDFNPRMTKPLLFFLERYAITHVMVENIPAFAQNLNLPGTFTRTYDGADFVLWSRAPVQQK